MPEILPKAIPPCPEVKKFFKENPEPCWDRVLNFFLDTFPQKQGRSIRYVIEGGVAVYLHNPKRQTPDDVDIIFDCLTPGYDYNYFSARCARDWLRNHKLPGNNQNEELLMGSYAEVDLSGRPVYVLNPVALAYSKSIGFSTGKPREKDIKDVALLGVDNTAIEAFRQQFLTPAGCR